jgi:hypothetical protein
MLIELITPLMLATSPMSIDVPKSTYDQGSQVSIYNTKTAQYRPPTFNGTQTYRYDGRPSDADND